jgi:hypothetical protein
LKEKTGFKEDRSAEASSQTVSLSSDPDPSFDNKIDYYSKPTENKNEEEDEKLYGEEASVTSSDEDDAPFEEKKHSPIKNSQVE